MQNNFMTSLLSATIAMITLSAYAGDVVAKGSFTGGDHRWRLCHG